MTEILLNQTLQGEGFCIPQQQLSSPERMTPYFPTYEYPRYKVRVDVVDGLDPRVAEAHEMEVAAMVDLGDPEHEVRAEFAPYMESSMYFLAYDTRVADGKMLGMGRIIPSNERTRNKSIQDLATIDSWTSDKLEKMFIVNSAGETEYGYTAEEVTRGFKAESGCESMDEVWDLSTLGYDLKLPETRKVKVAEAIIASFTNEAMLRYGDGKLSHVVSFNQVDAHGFFGKLGYPYHEMFDLEPMTYDSFDSGEGMLAQPGWISLREAAGVIEAQGTRHMGAVAIQLAASESACQAA